MKNTLKYEIVDKVSGKTGNTYKALRLYITDKYTKDVLCERAELVLLENNSNPFGK